MHATILLSIIVEINNLYEIIISILLGWWYKLLTVLFHYSIPFSAQNHNSNQYKNGKLNL